MAKVIYYYRENKVVHSRFKVVNDYATKTQKLHLIVSLWQEKGGKMLAALSLLKRFAVLILVPFAIFLLPSFLYVIIVLSLGKILYLFNCIYYFRYKTHCNS
ncbi:MAG: hypothetical protein DYG83_18070 [Candidatus Brocadia sp. AMX2]|nr:hypothetical protein [Candidatus Brocadia sp.]MBL1170800.1 hypothetical protein [Candidatus Brocadia sp. AMX1]MCE7868676.1 hypothetical protein [Candidatus Brocadia sp. AMX2]MCQ3919244.1 hypothetical protein [Candidatus Brocadia sp.]RIJ88521.1 MAG: hypothetical protein DB853_17825 [Candidatus Brocadia sp.]